MKLVIDRSKWYRGNGGEGSRLLRDDGKMCCLGFVAKQLGHTDEDIYMKSSPRYVVNSNCSYERRDGEIISWPLSDYDIDSLINVNDSTIYFPSDRESRIERVLKRRGIEVEFIN